MKMRVLLAILVTTLALGLAIVGVVAAQSPANPDPCGMGGAAAGGTTRGAGSAWSGNRLVAEVAQALNLKVQDVVAELQQGKTLRQVITAHDGNVDAIIESFMAARTADLDPWVKNGRYTQAQVDQMLSNMRQQVNAQLDRNPQNGPVSDCPMGGMMSGGSCPMGGVMSGGSCPMGGMDHGACQMGSGGTGAGSCPMGGTTGTSTSSARRGCGMTWSTTSASNN